MKNSLFSSSLDSSFKIYHELMTHKVRDILLVSTPYDAWIMEEDGRLSERIVNEYRGLNLSRPPKLTWAATAEEALEILKDREFQLVITMPRLADMNAYSLGQRIKAEHPDLPVVLLSHSPLEYEGDSASFVRPPGIDRSFVWSGNTDLLVAVVKSTEDRLNAAHDTAVAGVRIILFVENSPLHTSSLLPLLYKELVNQTRSVLEGKLNEEHRLLTMRARPKILLADHFEEAMALFEQFEPYVLGVISDAQFPRGGVLDNNAGFDLLREIKARRFDIPLLLTSVEPHNAERAAEIPAVFVDKSSPTLNDEIHDFFKYHLAFGDFIFRLPDGTEIDRASDLRTMEMCLRRVPDESLVYHASRNDFSRWLFTRTETVVASQIRDYTVADYPSVEDLRRHLISIIHARRTERQMGVVADFSAAEFDLVTKFFKIGQGSLGGKGRGLAFVASLLRQHEALRAKYEGIRLFVPRTLVITTEAFRHFVEENHLKHLAEADIPDVEIAERFLRGDFPASLENDLRAYLKKIRYPLAVRSSSLLEDAQFRAYAGLYRTYMLPNEHYDLEVRLQHLIHAIKLVYASTYFQGPKAFSKRVGRRTEEEEMAVLIQQLVGERYGDYFYPAVSGVAQSYNYYPYARMKPEDGIATIAMGFGRIVVEGGKALRFSPRHPQLLPQLGTVASTLKNAQQYFYALKMGEDYNVLGVSEEGNLVKREVADADDEYPMKLVASTYIPEENRIRDTVMARGYRVITFARFLKYNEFPLAALINDVLAMGQEGMGTPVELEFSINFRLDDRCKPEFAFLQLRPMTARWELQNVEVQPEEVEKAFCYSEQALGNVQQLRFADIVFVKPETFDRSKTREIAAQIGRFNAFLQQEERPYLLIGPGRWGTADRWLGIPVRWSDISGVGAIVETTSPELRAEPSQGSHFFHNITTLGINYITVADADKSFIKWDWLCSQPKVRETDYVAWARVDPPVVLKVDGRTSRCVLFQETNFYEKIDNN
ncbi:MAG: hypothetical protein D6775_09495 [Caldilineae bacterium]|nr:MAG: hypothetical protein D6775_09495 [Caldilineae bacterium]